MRKALNNYYAELLDVVGNDIFLYGYVFKDKSIRDARLHALEVSREMGIVPLPTVYRISRELHDKMCDKYALPTPMAFAEVEHETA